MRRTILSIKMSLLVLAVGMFTSQAFAQCDAAGNVYPGGTYTPPSGSYGSAATDNWAGEAIAVDVVAGDTYEFSTNASGGVTAGYDTQLTLRDAASGGTVLAYNDDTGGLQSYISWVSTITGTVWIHLHEYNCATNSLSTEVRIQRTLAAPSTNDALCSATAITVGNPAIGADNTGYTTEASEPSGSCYSGGAQSTAWYSFVSPASGYVTISTDYTGFTNGDTEIALYELAGACSNLSNLGPQLFCDQDGGVAETYNSIITTDAAPLTSGNTYYIQVSGYFGQEGTFEISVLETPPSNDALCDAFEIIVDDPEQTGNNTGYGVEAGEPFGACYSGGAQSTAWYYFTTPASGMVTVSTDFAGGTNGDTEIAIYELGGSCTDLTNLGPALYCDQDGGVVESYNSTFTTDGAPLAGSTVHYVQVSGWFGTTGSFDISVVEYFHPPNDALCNAVALVVNDPAIERDNTGYTTEASEPNGSCYSGGAQSTAWFSFVAPASGDVSVSTDYAGFTNGDTEIALYELTGLCNDLSSLGAELFCDQDGGVAENYNSIISTEFALLTGGTTYYIQVSGYFGTTGSFEISVVENTLTNDFLCASLELIVDAPEITETNLSHGVEVNEPTGSCYFGGAQATTWYHFTAPASGLVTVSTDFAGGTNGDTEIALYDGLTGVCGDLLNLGAELYCDQDGGVVENYNSTFTTDGAPLTGGNVYYVQVSGFFGSIGSYDISVVEYFIPPPDDLCNAVEIIVDAPEIAGDNTGYTVQTSEPSGSCYSGGAQSTAWYFFTAPASGYVTVSTDYAGGTNGDTEIALYELTGACTDLLNLGPELFCDQDGGTAANFNSVIVSDAAPLTGGNVYYVQVSGWNGTVGSFDISVDETIPTNDDLCDALPLVVDAPEVAGDNTGFSTEASEPGGSCYSGGAQATAWYSFVSPASGYVTISTDYAGGTNGDTEIALYELTGVCTDLSTLGPQLFCDQDGGVAEDYNSIIETDAAPLTAGNTYYIQVSGYFAQQGTFDISVTETPPQNDVLCEAFEIVVDAPEMAGDNTGYTIETSEPSGSCYFGGAQSTAWYFFTAPASGSVLVSTDYAGGTNGDTEIALFELTGACTDLANLGPELYCDQDGGAVENYNSVFNTAGALLTGGNVYYVQVSGYFGTTGSFDISVTENFVPNDNLCDAKVIIVDDPEITGDNTGYGVETNEPNGSCYAGGAQSTAWYSFVAPASGDVTVSTDYAGGTNGDTEIALYELTGACTDLANLGPELFCDQDGGGVADFNSVFTTAGAPLTGGNTYYVQVSGWFGSQGSFDISVEENTLPVNDDLCDVIALVVDDPEVEGNNTGYGVETNEPNGSCYAGGSQATAWYSFVAPASGLVTVSTDYAGGSNGDTEIALYEVTGVCSDLTNLGPELYCDQDGGVVANFNSTFTTDGAPLTGGTTYYVQVSGWFGTTGSFEISVDEYFIPPPDDLCFAEEIIVDATEIAGDNTGYTTEASEPTGSCYTGGSQATAWYFFTAPASGYVTVSTDYAGGTNGDTEIALYELTGACTDLSNLGPELFCDQDGGTAANFNSVIVSDAAPLTGGNVYYVQVSGWNGTEGSFDISVTETIPTNDDLCDAIAIVVDAPEIGGDNTGYGVEASEPGGSCYSGGAQATAWYSFVAPASGYVTVSTDYAGGTNGDTEIALYELTGVCTDLSNLGPELFCDQDGGGIEDFNSIMNTSASPLTGGTTYYVQVSGWFGSQGSFDISVVESVPQNDALCDAFEIIVDDPELAGDNTGYTTETSEPNGSCYAGGAQGTAWYFFVAPVGGLVTVSTDYAGGSNGDTEIAIYELTGSCADLANLGPELGCDQDGGVVANFNSVISTDASPLTGGTTYYVQVSGWFGTTGSFDISVVQNPTPLDDACSPGVVALGECGGTFDNTGFTSDGPDGGCWSGFPSGDLWVSFVAPAGGEVDIETHGNGGLVDTQIQLYADFSGACPSPTLTSLACDDDGGVGLASFINAAGLVAGDTYHVQIAGFNGAEGSFDISVIDVNAVPEDVCTGAILITCGDVLSGANNTTAYVEACTPLFGGAPAYVAPSVWYCYIATASEEITLTTCAATGYDTRISVLTGNCGSLTPVTDNDDDPTCTGFRSTAVFNATLGENYYFMIHGYGAGSTGTFDLAMTCAPLCMPQALNDDCPAAFNLPVAASGAAVPLTEDNSCALSGPQTSCEPFASTLDLWYEFTAPVSDLIITATLGTATELNYALWDACGGTQLGLCISSVNGEQVITGFTPATQYFLQVWSTTGTTGSYDISIELTPPPPANDDVCSAIPIIVDAASSIQTNAYSTDDGGLLGCWFGTGPVQDVWFSFVAPGLGAVDIETFDIGGMNDTQIGLWEVSGCPGGPASYDTEVACDDDAGAGLMSLIGATGLTAGATYYVQVSGYNGQFGDFRIRITTPPAVSHDLPCDAVTILVGSECNYVTGDNTGATSYIDNTCSFSPGYSGTWFKATVPASGTLVLNTFGGAVTDAIMTAYTMTDCADIDTWTAVECDDDDGHGFMSYMYLDGDQGLSPGDVVYIQIASYSAFSQGDFQICATRGIVWEGGTSASFATGSNWFHDGPAPTADENMIIPTLATNDCNIDAVDADVKTLWVNSGGALDVYAGRQLTVNETLDISSSIDFGLGIVRLGGAASQQIVAGPGSSIIFNELMIDNAAGVAYVEIGSVPGIQINEILDLNDGDFDISGGSVLMVSNATQTAYVDDWNGTGGTAVAAGTLTGDITIQKYIPAASGYHHISPMVDNPSITELGEFNLYGADNVGVTPIGSAGAACADTTLAPGSNYGSIFQFVENHPNYTGDGCVMWGWVVRSAGTLESGRGYASRQPNGSAFTMDMTGAIKTSPASYGAGALGNAGGGNGFQLVGNPFAAPIAWGGVTGFSGAAYTWNDLTGTYVSYPPFLNAPLSIGQGFFVESQGMGNTFTLDHTNKVAGDPTFYRASSVIGDYSLNLDVWGNGFGHFTVIAFADELGGSSCTDGWDIACDAYALPGNTGQPFMYSMTTQGIIASPNRLQYNTQSPLEGVTRSVPLALDPGANGTFTISATDLESFPSGTGIVLEDTKLGLMHDLNANPVYTFTGLASDYDPNNPTNRFVVHFSPASVTDIDNVIDINAGFYTAGEELVMQLNILEPVEGIFSVLNAVGQEVMSNDNITTINGRHTKNVSELANGVYIVRFVTEGKTFSGKFVKH